MRSKICLLKCLGVTTLAACSSSLGPVATLPLSRPPDFAATVARIGVERGISPDGAYSQVDAWLVIRPSRVANAGLVMAKTTPVFVRTDGAVFSSRAGDIKAGDRVEVWHDFRVAFGAVEGPPGSPTYFNILQVVIDR